MSPNREAAYYWVGDRGSATGGNVPPDAIIALPSDVTPEYVAGFRQGWSVAVDAFLASPQAAEELARALYDGLNDNGDVRIDADSPKELGDVTASVLYAWQKVRHPEDG